MYCPRCEGDSFVTSTRPYHGGRALWRRRECYECHQRWTTYESTTKPRKPVKKEKPKPPPQRCSIDGCLGHVVARGWCSTHYQRFHRHGSPHVVKLNPITHRLNTVRKGT